MTVAPEMLHSLASLDTPTVCNALEIVAPARRSTGFNRRPLYCPFPARGPVVGFARTATIRSREPQPGDNAQEVRLAYYRYIEVGLRPAIAVIQDLDGPDRGLGAFWGEVQTSVHKALGCTATITDGSVRDLDQMAEGFFVLAGSVMPSHAFVHLVDFGKPVNVAGMNVSSGDLVHSDRHGAVVIPDGLGERILEAAALLAQREKLILDASKRRDFSNADIKAALDEAQDIH